MGVGGEKMPGIDTKSRKSAKVALLSQFLPDSRRFFGPDGAARSGAKKIGQIMSRFSDKVREILPSAHEILRKKFQPSVTKVLPRASSFRVV